MTKIYNEVLIDMNPESSFYRETLHEDSFEYDGPMALLASSDSTFDRFYIADDGTSLGEWDGWKKEVNYNGRKFWIVRTRGSGKKMWDDKWALVSDDDTSKVLHYSFNDSDFEDAGWQWSRDFLSNDPTYSSQAGGPESQETFETAEDINYTDLSKFLDSEGNISDKYGMQQYLITLPQFEGKSTPELESAMEDMPKMSVSERDMAGARAQSQGDIYGLQQGMTEDRAKSSAQAGASGMYSPTSTGFGGDTSSVYGNLADVSSGAQDMYGLGVEQEDKFADWLSRHNT